jgi:integrase
MALRKGYSVYQRSGQSTWTVKWTDGEGRCRYTLGIHTKAAAGIVGRAKAAEADLVRCGVLDPSALKIAGALREPIETHSKAWLEFLRNKGNTESYVEHQGIRVNRLFDIAKVGTLRMLDSDGIQAALATIAKKSSPQTARHYHTALKGFVRWCLRSNRLRFNPIAAVARPNAAGETFSRYPLSDSEVSALLDVAGSRGFESGVSGKDWSWFDRIMAYTGLRVSEARSLKPESFNLDIGMLTLEAAYSKHRKQDEIPLRADFVELIRPWLASKPPGEKLFPFPRGADLPRVFLKDCATAGIESPDGVKLGMHSFRRWFITHAVRAGGLADAQSAARHSTPALTKKYADLTRADRDKTLSGLPPVNPPIEASPV